MLSASRINRKKIALTITRPVSFSCVYLTCMKNNTTRMALKVAMVRAVMVLKGPMSTTAAATVSPGNTRRVSQIATDEPSEETCSAGESSCVEWLSGKTSSDMGSPVAVDQVEQWEKINPDNVDEVPVQAGIFDRREVIGRVFATPRHERKKPEQADTDNHVQSVHSGHREVEREKHFGMVRVDRQIGMTGHGSREGE